LGLLISGQSETVKYETNNARWTEANC
jgi:hypothetical protein